MSIQNYIDEKKEIYDILIDFLDDSDGASDYYQQFTETFEKQKIKENKSDLQILLNLISKITKNHHRSHCIHEKINQILHYLEIDIKQTFSNLELFDIFKNSYLILLFLFENKIISIDKELFTNKFSTLKGIKKYRHFFYPEIKKFLEENLGIEIKNKQISIDQSIFDNFDEKRKIGENENYICQLIRDDSIIEFITYVNQRNLSLSYIIKPSIFETNSFLINKEVTLIEYASFYGSIQIFKYLQMNNVKLSESLLIYAIHGRNAELIHILEELYNLKQKDQLVKKCLDESIKCHHNEITKYIKDNYIYQDISNEIEDFLSFFSTTKSDKEFEYDAAFHYYNFGDFPDDFTDENIFKYLCKYNYFDLVKIFLESQKLSKSNIQIFCFLNEILK